MDFFWDSGGMQWRAKGQVLLSTLYCTNLNYREGRIFRIVQEILNVRNNYADVIKAVILKSNRWKLQCLALPKLPAIVFHVDKNNDRC